MEKGINVEGNKEEENKTIVKFNPTLSEIMTLVAETKKIVPEDVGDMPGYLFVKSCKKKLADLRIIIQKYGKEQRAEAIKFQKEVLRQENEILEKIEPEETRLGDMVAAYDANKIMQERIKTLPLRKAALGHIGITEINEQYILSLDNIEFATYFENKKKEVAETEARKQAEIALAIKTEAEIQIRIAKEREQAVLDEKRRAETEKAEIEKKIAEERKREEILKQEREQAVLNEKQRVENEKAEQEKKIAEERKKAEANEKFQNWLAGYDYKDSKEEMNLTTEIVENGTKYKLWKKISEIII